MERVSHRLEAPAWNFYALASPSLTSSHMLIQFILILAMILALIVTWRRTMQQVIRPLEAIAWSLVWIGASIVILLPNVTTRVAQFFGVGRGVDFVLYGSVATLFLLIFKLFIQHEKLERKLTDMVRHDALRSLKQE